jgi:hypothetical protein
MVQPISKRINKLITLQRGNGDASPIAFFSFDDALVAVAFESHPVPLPPPVVHLSGERQPHAAFSTQLSKQV